MEEHKIIKNKYGSNIIFTISVLGDKIKIEVKYWAVTIIRML